MMLYFILFLVVCYLFSSEIDKKTKILCIVLNIYVDIEDKFFFNWFHILTYNQLLLIIYFNA